MPKQKEVNNVSKNKGELSGPGGGRPGRGRQRNIGASAKVQKTARPGKGHGIKMKNGRPRIRAINHQKGGGCRSLLGLGGEGGSAADYPWPRG